LADFVFPRGFEWHSDKAVSNLRKHGISFEDAVTAFEDPFGVSSVDKEEHEGEDRVILFAQTLKLQLLTICFAERGTNIRIISARPATKTERNFYEQNQF
jgi:uncharacterized protein